MPNVRVFLFLLFAGHHSTLVSCGFSQSNTSLDTIYDLSSRALSDSRVLPSTAGCLPGYGLYQSDTGQSLCELCPAGFFSSGGSGSKCSICDQFSYAVSPGSAACTACPNNQWVGYKGSSSALCLCRKAYYFAFFLEASLKRRSPPAPSDILQSLSYFSAPSESFCLP